MRPAPETNDVPELQAAAAKWTGHDLAGALQLIGAAVTGHPNNVRVLTTAARYLAAAYQYRGAESLLARARGLSRGRGPLLAMTGRTYRLIRRVQRGIDCQREALAASDAPPLAHWELAQGLERLNRLDEALLHLERYLAAGSAEAEAMLLQGRILRRMQREGPAREALQQVARRAPQWTLQSKAEIEIALLHDASQEYAEAWQAAERAKALARPHATPAVEHKERLLPALGDAARAFRKEHLDRWRARRPKPLRAQSALLTGMPRSGTTLLERMLDRHPQVVGCDEFDFFPRLVYPAMVGGRDPATVDLAHFDALDDDRLETQFQRYCVALREAVSEQPGDEVLLDKSPSLLPLLVPYWRLSPHSVAVVALRDPRDVLVSCFLSDFPLNDFSVDFLDLESAAARVASDLETWIQVRSEADSGWIEVHYEETVADAERAARRVTGALGVIPSSAMSSTATPATASVVHSRSYDSVDQPIHRRSLARWRNYEQQLAPALPHLTGVLAPLGYEA